MTMDYDAVWAAHEEIAQRMVDMVRAWTDPDLEGTSEELLELASSAEHPEILACILAAHTANLLDTHVHNLGEPH